MSIETLIEQDLQKLQEENQEVVDDDGNGDWQEDGSESSDVEEEGNVEEPENAEGDAEKAEGDAEKEGVEGPPGSVYQDEEPEDYFDDEDLDPIILGVRIYTKGGVVVSVTGNVVGEVINEGEGEGEAETDEDMNLKKKAKKEKGD
jgi:hypothetical protein